MRIEQLMVKSPKSCQPGQLDEVHYKDLRRKHVLRLFLTYLLPLILLTLYFFVQHGAVVSESERLHLRALAENQAKTLDLFLSERRVNLVNLISDPRLSSPPDSRILQAYLEDLKKMSETFVDLGYFDLSGVQAAYAGPYPSLEKRSYRAEPWYLELLQGDDDFIITDIYHGFRQKLHFTIAVKRVVDRRDPRPAIHARSGEDLRIHQLFGRLREKSSPRSSTSKACIRWSRSTSAHLWRFPPSCHPPIPR